MGKEHIGTTASATCPWLFLIQILRNGQTSHGATITFSKQRFHLNHYKPLVVVKTTDGQLLLNAKRQIFHAYSGVNKLKNMKQKLHINEGGRNMYNVEAGMCLRLFRNIQRMSLTSRTRGTL